MGLLALLVVVILVMNDQVLKMWIVQHFAAPTSSLVATADDPITIIPGYLQLTRLHNTGAAWSSFAGMRWLLVGSSVLMVGILIFLLLTKKVRHPVGFWACILIISGGIGNLIDRVVNGYVVDMIQVTFIDFPVFNLADCFVCIGAFFGVIYYLFFLKYDERKRPLPADNSEEELNENSKEDSSVADDTSSNE